MSSRLIATLLAILVVIACVLFLREMQPVVLPFLFALLLSYLAYPIVHLLTRARVPTAAAIAVVVLLALMVLGGLGLLVRESVNSFLAAYPNYEPRIQGLWTRVTTGMGVTSEYLQQLDVGKEIGAFAAATLGSLLGLLADFLLVLFYLVFLLLGRFVIPRKIKKAFNPERGTEILKVLDEIEDQALRYVGLMTLISFASALVVYGILIVYGVEFALLWGILIFIGNFIPNVGPILASIPPILVALVQFESPWTAASLGAVLTAVQMVLGNFIEPRVMGRGLELDPLVVLFGLVFFGWLWGVAGALLAVPLMVVMRIVCENFKTTRPIAVMMGSNDAASLQPRLKPTS